MRSLSTLGIVRIAIHIEVFKDAPLTCLSKVFDSFAHVLGGFRNPRSILHTEYPDVKIVDSGGNVTNPSYRRTSPDHILIQGSLQSGALASISFRATVGEPVDNTSIRWIISGTTGEIEVHTTNQGWQMDPPGSTLKVKNGANIETVDLSTVEEVAAVSQTVSPGTNTARAYEAFASGEKYKFASFSDALLTQCMLDSIRAASQN